MSKRILVVEDHADNRQIIRDMLAVTDYEITEAETGEEALAAIAKQRPDLILMDIPLPTMDGYEATRRIKADASLRSIPIVAVTSYARNYVIRAMARSDYGIQGASYFFKVGRCSFKPAEACPRICRYGSERLSDFMCHCRRSCLNTHEPISTLAVQ
jgi:two-component system cell cycle response regulator DivK